MKALILGMLGLVLVAGPSSPSHGEPPAMVIVDFQEDRRWFPVNDGVMGGVSQSGLERTAEGTGIFSGHLSLENNGGFASVRTMLMDGDLSDHEGIELKVRGDGRVYQLRFRADDQFDGVAYRALFPTSAGQWNTVRLPFAEFDPTFRGRILDGYPPLATGSLVQLSIMLADKNEGPFRLEIGSITTYRETD